MARDQTFVYSAENVPVGGKPGDVLVKVSSPNYYTAWRSLPQVFDEYEIVLDDGYF